MKNNTYRNTVEHLRFSHRFAENVTAQTVPGRHRFRFVRMAAVTAAVLLLLAVTATAAIPGLREYVFGLSDLGTSAEDLSGGAQGLTFPTDAAPRDEYLMNRITSGSVEGVSIHYMELDAKLRYTFNHGMLFDGKTFWEISDEYMLSPVPSVLLELEFEKSGTAYTKSFRFIDTGTSILSSSRYPFPKNQSGEILLNLSAPGSHQWPVYLNPETGSIRDALPQLAPADFEGRIAYTDPLNGGLLVSTVVNDGVVTSGNSASYNLLYWIAEGSKEAICLEMPENWDAYYWDNGILYCTVKGGKLYMMDLSLQFQPVSDYKTTDSLTNGLLTVMTNDRHLAIADILSGNVYVMEDIVLGSVREIDETMGYNATRYSRDSAIALVQTRLLTEEKRVALINLGILDTEDGTLRMLEIENTYDGYHVGWLDEYRLAVIYEDGPRQYLCVYEFE